MVIIMMILMVIKMMMLMRMMIGHSEAALHEQWGDDHDDADADDAHYSFEAALRHSGSSPVT